MEQGWRPVSAPLPEFDRLADSVNGTRTALAVGPAGADEHFGPNERPRTAIARRWLILADRGGKGQQLAEHLTARGDHCTLAFADERHKRTIQ